MKIAVIGLWHLGTITSLCLAKIGHKIVAFDKKNIIKKFQNKILPIDEPLVRSTFNKKKNITFDHELKNLSKFKVVWITYDSIIDEKDSSNPNQILEKIKIILKYLSKNTLLIISSQIPVETISKLEKFEKLYIKKNIDIAYIPENLRLGNSIKLFLKPDRLIIGKRNQVKNKKKILSLLRKIRCKKIFVTPESAEMTKHVINSFLALSISFINEIGQISRIYKIPFQDLEKAVKTDQRIGTKSYLSIGNAYSGGTLARDVNFLLKDSIKLNTNNKILKSINTSNNLHSSWFKDFIKSNLNNRKKKILQIGLGYKDKTTTLRRSLPYNIFLYLKKKNKINIIDQYLFNNSNEIKKIKKYFINQNSKEKFDIILLFKKVNNIKFLKNKITNKTLVIDGIGKNKNIFIKSNLNYKSFENV